MLAPRLIITRAVRVDAQASPAALRGAVHESVALIEKEVRDRTPQGVGGAQSGLRSSIFGEVHEAPGLFTGVVGTPMPHAAAIEHGRRAGAAMPPPAALIPWIAKFLTLEEGQDAEDVAFVVARAIARRGVPGTHMFELGLDAARPTIERIFADAGERISMTLLRPIAGPVAGEWFVGPD